MSGISHLFHRTPKAPTHGPSREVLASVVIKVVEIDGESVTLSVGPTGIVPIEVSLAEDEMIVFNLSTYRFDG